MKQSLIRWLGWINLALCVAVYLAMWVFYSRLAPALMAALPEYVSERKIAFAPVVAFPLVGALILHFRPRNSIGLLFALVGATQAVAFFATPYAIYSLWVSPEQLPFTRSIYLIRNSVWVFLLAISSILPLLFPDGRLLSKRWRILLIAVSTASALVFVWGLSAGVPQWESDPFPIASAGAESTNILIEVLLLLLLAAIPVALFSLLLRWQRARALERQQIRWLLLGAIVMFIALFLVILPDFLGLPRFPLFMEQLMANLAFLALPFSVGTAILRHRLFDIDVIIRKTLVYALLSATLALVYFGSVILLQTVVAALSGQHSTAVIVLSTLLIAALFQPLRGRLQRVIDRRFYRQKIDRQQVMEQFARTARDEVSLATLEAEVVRVVQETMQPERTAVWLRSSLSDGRTTTP